MTTSVPLARPDYALADNLGATSGAVFLTGTQALIRVALMQSARDRARGLDTRGFISGYRGSPLGMVDQQAWKAKARLDAAGVDFLPAINEELGATAVLGTQRVESDPERTCDGVFAMWYGKGPGVDRAGDALKHGNAYGSSPHGGVLVVAGDDHGCVSSSMPHQSDVAMQSWHMPVLAPASVAEFLSFGLYGIALARWSGNWVGFTALSEVVESASTVDLDAVNAEVATWHEADALAAATGFVAPAGGLHYRWPDLPSLAIETRLHAKLEAVGAFARVNSVDRTITAPARPVVGIVTVGKAHLDLLEVLRRLDLPLAALEAAGVAVYKVGLSYPIETTRVDRFAEGLEEILVVEEKAPVVETQLRERFYNRTVRPRIVGKTDAEGRPLVSALGELRPSRLIETVARWLAARFPALDRRPLVVDFTPPELLSNAGDAVKRVPYFCAGCPHNTSTRVPEGSRAQAGIGCHFMASWMDRDTAGLIQMGGEGVDWVSHSRFTRVPHVFQNLGDGTYYHSGYLAIRQAIAAKANVTYKILFNDAVAMTGGQPVDGVLTVDAIARQVEAEGAAAVAVLSDDIARFDDIRGRFPEFTTFHGRDDLDAVQRTFRETAGVTVLIYEQTCAAEKRRRRKKGELADPPRRLFVNARVCEGCGDCSVQSNCVAVVPLETERGRKRRIDQSACNKDYSCEKGFCPSFVSVVGGTLRKKQGALAGGDGASRLAALVDALPPPAPHVWTGPFDLLVTGVGGTGVVTVGAVIAMAAHLEGKSASVLDFMGFAQKGGSVLSFVRLADRADRLHQVRIDAQQADAVLACDLVVAASPEALGTVRRGRTRVLANTHGTPVAESIANPDADLRTPALLEKLRFAAGEDRVDTMDAQTLAETFLGDSIVSNIVALGSAWQRGLVPVGLPAMRRAIELNGVAVAQNLAAFALGRLAAADADACRALLEAPPEAAREETLAEAVEREARWLEAYQDRPYAERFRRIVARVEAREREVVGAASGLPLARAVTRSLARLMAYKDEYEVARLHADGVFERALADTFDGDPRIEFHMAPPAFVKPKGEGAAKPPRKIRLGSWMWPVLRLLRHGKRLRGTAFDPFGRTEERRLERQLVRDHEARVDDLLVGLTRENAAVAVAIAEVPGSIRGYGHVKLASLAIARARERELLSRFDPVRWPKPEGRSVAGQFKGIAITSGG